MIIDITESISKNSTKTTAKDPHTISNKFYNPLREELSNFYRITTSNFNPEEIETFEYVISELLKTHYLALEQLKQSAKYHSNGHSFSYYVDASYIDFNSAEEYVMYLYNDSNYAVSLTDAFQDNKRMRDVIFHFMDTAQARLLDAFS